jgi:hypothetical protein
MPRSTSGAAFPLPHLARNSFEAARPEHQFAKKQESEAQEGAVQEEQVSIHVLAALNTFMDERSEVDLQLDVGQNVRTWPCMPAAEIP